VTHTAPLSSTPIASTRGARPQRRGVIFVAALAIVIVLGTLVLVLTQEMRTEAIASANRMSATKADAIEMGAEQWVLAQIALNTTDAATIETTPAWGIPVGDGYFWIIRIDPIYPDTYDFGIADECSKLNINSATSDQLMVLPNMTTDIAAAIIEWRGGNTTGGPGSTYYGSLPDAYQEKLAPFETVEELLMVKDVTPQLMYGLDRNRDGVVTDTEKNATTGNSATSAFATSGNDDGRGWYPYLTVYSISTSATGGGTTGGATGGTTGGTGAGGATTPGRTGTGGGTAGGATGGTTGGATGAGGGKTTTGTTTGGTTTGGRATTVTGLVNVNTASSMVLQCLGLSQSDAESIINTRQASSPTSGTSWLSSAVGTSSLRPVQALLTGQSSQYSADIVAVSGDGRSFKRVRIVIDARSTPAQIIYRKDLTELGWPLPQEIQDSLRAGKGPGTAPDTINQ
jgi:DNA uptake protein ComE-like DNA-binding protein